MPEAETKAIVLYDGVCGLCNRAVQFLLKRDRHDRLQFASLQSDLAARVLPRHGMDPKGLDTVYAVLNYGEPNETLLGKGDAFGVWLESSKSFRGRCATGSTTSWRGTAIRCSVSLKAVCSPTRSKGISSSKCEGEL